MTTLQDVLTFLNTATITERNQISMALSTSPNTNNRKVQAAITLSQIGPGSPVKFNYDTVDYEAVVVKINQTTANVRITKIDGMPRRSISVGTVIRVGASLLKTV